MRSKQNRSSKPSSRFTTSLCKSELPSTLNLTPNSNKTDYHIFRTNYKQQEINTMAKLDNLAKNVGQSKKKGINEAAGDNDAIRQWVSIQCLTSRRKITPGPLKSYKKTTKPTLRTAYPMSLPSSSSKSLVEIRLPNGQARLGTFCSSESKLAFSLFFSTLVLCSVSSATRSIQQALKAYISASSFSLSVSSLASSLTLNRRRVPT